jgi:hypothetical protein
MFLAVSAPIQIYPLWELRFALQLPPPLIFQWVKIFCFGGGLPHCGLVSGNGLFCMLVVFTLLVEVEPRPPPQQLPTQTQKRRFKPTEP